MPSQQIYQDSYESYCFADKSLMSTNSLQIRLSFVFHKVGWITDSKYFNQPSFSHFFNGCGLCLEYFSMHWDVVTNTCMLLVGIE